MEQAAVAVDKRRPPAARVIAAGALDLDHVGAEMRQDFGGEWAGQVLRDFDDFDAGQRQHGRSPRVAVIGRDRAILVLNNRSRRALAS